MKNRIIFWAWVIFSIITLLGIFTYAIIRNIEDNTIVETYEDSLDGMSIDFDTENHQYDVLIFATKKHYFVKLKDVVLVPYTENEIYIEVTKSGKCKLYFFIKWEGE